MSRVLIHVEGPSEETFINEVLAPHLYAHGLHEVSPRLIGNGRARYSRGGIVPWGTASRDIVAHLKQDQARAVSTMVDYYGLPAGGAGAWPGRASASSAPLGEKSRIVSHALREAVARELGPNHQAGRFIPFVAMHEFEALLFSDPDGFARGIGQPALAQELRAIRDAFVSPEEINDSPATAPSKRIIALYPAYQKPLMGTLAALEVGLEAMRRECPGFDQWVTALEALA